MKFAPISPAEQSRIIHELAQKGRWEGTRRGVAVRFVRYEGQDKKQQIHFAIRHQGRWISAQAFTVAEAIELVNRAIVSGRPTWAEKHSGNAPEESGAPSLI
jgi:hypothetical protein